MKRINALLKRLAVEQKILLTVEAYSPGDGWSRYSIHTSKEGYRIKSSMKRSECELVLEGMIEVLQYKDWSEK